MASSVALASAPPDVFVALDETLERVWDPHRPADRTHNPIPRAGGADDDNAAAQAAPSWRAEGLSLRHLHGLACALNPSAEELAPVQAWFEMAAVYPTEVLLRGDVLARLRAAFAGVVRCPHYGAAIHRDAFESIVRRIVGPEVEAWQEEEEGGEGGAVAGRAGLGSAVVLEAGAWAGEEMETEMGEVDGGLLEEFGRGV